MAIISDSIDDSKNYSWESLDQAFQGDDDRGSSEEVIESIT